MNLSSSTPSAPSIGILTHTAIADDPRVRRQVEAFDAAGWRVFGFGATGARSPPPPGRLFQVEMPAPDHSIKGRLRRLAVLSRLKVMPWAADAVFWQLPENYRAIFHLAEPYRPELWLANDWTMLPVAARLSQPRNTPFIYDTHEFAFHEFPENWKWQTFVRPLVRRIEACGIACASHVTCVSGSIAAGLQQVYGLKRSPTVVRNLPAYSAVAFRPTGERIEVIYHGIVIPNRGLEQSIISVAMWRPEFTLTIRGPASEGYLTSLKSLAAATGVADRVRFSPPVPFTELVASAAHHDIGLFVLPARSRQNEFVLPNKLFEYTMAGLAVCVSNVPEMATIVRQFGHGRLVEGLEPQAIAKAINAFDRAQIDACKLRSIETAKELCWEREQQKLLAIAEGIVRETKAA